MSTRAFSQLAVRDLLRTAGGVLLAAAGFALYIRKEPEWGQGGLMLAMLIPAVVLYALAVMGRAELPVARIDAAPWQSVLMVISLLLVPIALLRFLGWVGATTSDSLIQALAFALSAGVGILGVLLTRVRYAALLSTLFLLVAWLAVWDKIINHPSGTTERWLLFAFAGLFTGVAAILTAQRVREATEVVTAAGIAAVLCGFLGIVGSLISRFTASAGAAFGTTHVVGVSGVRQHFIWDLFLLAVSLALIWYGSRARVRGPGYVGAFGVLLFIVSVGAQVAAVQASNEPSRSFVGWPLALLLIGAAALAAGVVATRLGSDQAADGASAGTPAPPPGAET